MHHERNNNLSRIAVFYDGNYFLHVSNYYNYTHERQARLSIAGLHHFIRNRIAQEEGRDEKLCQIVDAHYFRGRLTAYEANQLGNSLYYERMFDDILSSEGVTTHYLPVRTNHNGLRQEKGIDVWLALEAFELAFYKRFDVFVLIASDGDYVPLIRKLNSLGTRVMVLSWDFEYTNDRGKVMVTRTSQDLLEEVTYPIAMHEIIDNRVNKNQPIINNLFVPQPTQRYQRKPATQSSDHEDAGQHELVDDDDVEMLPVGLRGNIINKKNGFGFIRHPDYKNNLFFYFQSLINIDFNELEDGDEVEFSIGKNDRGEHIAVDVKLIGS